MTKPGRALDTSWSDEAKCSGRSSDMFFPDEQADEWIAKAFCRGYKDGPTCPVMEQCLAYALARGERHGVWGGHTVKEREQIRRMAVA